MDMLLFNDLERLRRTGNFSQAAERGNISQPAFSRRIKALESWAGVNLVDRSRQPVKLTEAGLQLLEAGLHALAHLEQERSKVLATHSEPEDDKVTFGVQHSISWRFYTNWLKSLEDAHGPFRSRLRTDDMSHCLVDLEAGDVDFVVVYALANEVLGAEQSIVIGTDTLLPVCKPDSQGDPVFDLTRKSNPAPLLAFGQTDPISGYLKPMFEAHDLEQRLQTVYKNAVAGALLMRARDGGGVAWLPKSLVAADLENQTLVQTGHRSWTVPLEIRLLRDAQHANPLTRSIWQCLTEPTAD